VHGMTLVAHQCRQRPERVLHYIRW